MIELWNELRHKLLGMHAAINLSWHSMPTQYRRKSHRDCTSLSSSNVQVPDRGGLAVFPHHSDTSSLGIRMPSLALALEFNSRADKETWVTTVEGNENNLSRQGLYAVADFWVTTWTADWAVPQTVCSTEIALPTLYRGFCQIFIKCGI